MSEKTRRADDLDRAQRWLADDGYCVDDKLAASLADLLAKTRDAALEEAAKECDRWANQAEAIGNNAQWTAAVVCARNIRARI